jgi:competence CoiA-like predicted nuclease
MDIRRTIEDVFDIENGLEITATKFFRQPFDVITQARSEQELANQGKRSKWLVCSTCGENIRILGGKTQYEITKPGKNFHFAHLHNSKDCPIKTTSKYSREDINRMQYRGIAEGLPHIELKEKLYQGLNLNAINKGQVTDLQLERVIRSLDENEWRKPDINLKFIDQRVAVELQLSTTWLDVIVGRQAFYREEGIFILWIFNEFNYKDNTRKLAFSDIIYTNNYNAFIFDEEARDATLKQKDLVLKCYFQHHYAKDDQVISNWENELVTLEQLAFDRNTMKVYYRDIALEKQIASAEVRKFKAKQAKEIEDNRRERNRLRAIRAEHQSAHQTITGSMADIDKKLELLDKKRSNNYQSLLAANNELANVTETARDIVTRLDSYWRPLPPAAERIKSDLILKSKELNESIKSLDEQIKKWGQKDHYYRKGRVKLLNGIEYHVLDRKNQWDLIINNANRIYAYRNDQANNLFAAPELQPLNSHKAMQMRNTAQVEFVINYAAEFAENTSNLNEAEQRMKSLKAVKETFDKDAPVMLAQSLQNQYTLSVSDYQQEEKQIRSQISELNEEKQRLDLAADEHRWKIIQLDYMDDYDEDDLYH